MRQEAFDAKFPPFEGVSRRFIDKLIWPDTYTERLLRVDPAMKIIDRSELEIMGCAHRHIYRETADIPAKPDWSCERQETILSERIRAVGELKPTAYRDSRRE